MVVTYENPNKAHASHIRTCVGSSFLFCFSCWQSAVSTWYGQGLAKSVCAWKVCIFSHLLRHLAAKASALTFFSWSWRGTRHFLSMCLVVLSSVWRMGTCETGQYEQMIDNTPTILHAWEDQILVHSCSLSFVHTGQTDATYRQWIGYIRFHCFFFFKIACL